MKRPKPTYSEKIAAETWAYAQGLAIAIDMLRISTDMKELEKTLMRLWKESVREAEFRSKAQKRRQALRRKK